MGKIIVPVNQELIDLNPDAKLETLLGETLTVEAPGFGTEEGDGSVATADADGPGPHPVKPPTA